LEGLILRPLSAKLLEPTLMEKNGRINRDKLLDLSGRTRRPQIELAKVYGIRNYPCPAGGCLLTDPTFCKRVEDLLEYGKFNLKEVNLLKMGRHFRITPEFKLIVARDEKESNSLFQLREKEDIVFKTKNGPLGLGKGRIKEEEKIIGARIVARYASLNGEVEVNILEKEEKIVRVKKIEKEDLEKFRI
jgi:hypothetical protein